jgi:hypothetical protein
MRSSTRLVLLRNRAVSRFSKLAYLARAIRVGQTPGYDEAICYLTIELANTWSLFVREWYISCTVLRAVRVSGSAVMTNRGFGHAQDAILFALQVVGPKKFQRVKNQSTLRRRDEPTWLQPSTILVLARTLSLSNESNLTAAMSFPTTAFRDLPSVRNFYAHRSPETAQKVKSIALRYGVGIRHPNEFAVGRWGSRSQIIVEEWIDDLRDVSVAMCD